MAFSGEASTSCDNLNFPRIQGSSSLEQIHRKVCEVLDNICLRFLTSNLVPRGISGGKLIPLIYCTNDEIDVGLYSFQVTRSRDNGRGDERVSGGADVGPRSCDGGGGKMGSWRIDEVDAVVEIGSCVFAVGDLLDIEVLNISLIPLPVSETGSRIELEKKEKRLGTEQNFEEPLGPEVELRNRILERLAVVRTGALARGSERTFVKHLRAPGNCGGGFGIQDGDWTSLSVALQKLVSCKAEGFVGLQSRLTRDLVGGTLIWRDALRENTDRSATVILGF
nr:hypothetical protein Iba_chr03bCG7410 [Ipomoea batatas]